jgi:hypothetical protein
VSERNPGTWPQGVGFGATFDAGIAVTVCNGAACGVAGVGVSLRLGRSLTLQVRASPRPSGVCY